MNVLAPFLVITWLVCAAASPTSRHAYRAWSRGVHQALMPRRLFAGCLIWLIIGWFVGTIILTGWFALLVIAPAFAIADLLARRHTS